MNPHSRLETTNRRQLNHGWETVRWEIILYENQWQLKSSREQIPLIYTYDLEYDNQCQNRGKYWNQHQLKQT